MTRRHFALGPLLAISLAGSPASATLFSYVVTGTVGAVGSGQTALPNVASGSTFTATFLFNDDAPNATYKYDGIVVEEGGFPHVSYRTIPGSTAASGASCFGAVPTCAVTGTLFGTANIAAAGSTFAIGDTYPTLPETPDADRIFRSFGYSINKFHPAAGEKEYKDQIALDISYSQDNGCCEGVQYQGGIHFNLFTPQIRSTDFREPLSIDIAPDSGSTGQVLEYQGPFFGTANSLVSLIPTHLSVTALTSSAVPEPSTWLLELVGFGMVGTMIRRQRKEGRRDTLKAA